jgi:hypothetical protein
MKYLPFLFFLLAAGCRNDKNDTIPVGQDVITHGEMDTSETGFVVIRITESNSYCGGAKPTEEMYRQITAQKPLPGKTVFIKRNEGGNSDEPVLLTISTDDSGYVRMKMQPGDYILVDEKKQDRTFYNNFLSKYNKPTDYFTAIDTVCLETWFRTPDLIFTVVKGATTSYEVNFHNPCPWRAVPCSNYTGPLPP